MRAAVRTDPGRIREVNEDRTICDAALGLLLVADGMGGHAAGEIASAMAVDVIAAAVRAALWGRERGNSTEVPSLLTHAVTLAGRAIHARAAEDPGVAGMGTTVVLALARAECLYIAHVGDSRAYLMHGDSLRQLTRDHSLIAEMVSNGEVTVKEARTHRLRHLLSRSLGPTDTPKVDVQVVPWEHEDCLLLCSDGLNSMVDDRRIARVIARFHADLDRACEELVRVANTKGGKDNISVILACRE